MALLKVGEVAPSCRFAAGDPVMFGRHPGKVVCVDKCALFRAHGWLVTVRLAAGGTVVCPPDDLTKGGRA